MKKVRKHNLLKIVWCVLALLMVGLIVFLFYYCKILSYNNKAQIINNSEKRTIDFYYRDTVFLPSNKALDTVICEYSNLKYEDGRIYLINPDKLDPAYVYSKIYLLSGKDTTTLDVSIRCWINGQYSLTEVDPQKPNKSILWEAAKRKLNIETEYDEILLLTKNDSSYLYSKGKLVVDTKEGRTIISNNFTIKSPIYNQLIINGQIGCFRTEHEIYVSRDGLKSWKQIYHGPRAIRESMVYIEKDTSLLFSQYVPGTTRVRHYLLKYNLRSEVIDTVQTFYTLKEKHEKGLLPVARHTHVLCEDPYTQDIFVGNGDGDEEAGIFVSHQDKLQFRRLGGGDQSWRTLQFFFGDHIIFWDTDSDFPQYLTGIKREKLLDSDIKESDLIRVPLFNSACWCAVKYGDMYLLPSNSEGCLYDVKHRLYGIVFDSNDYPVVYNLIEEVSQKNIKGSIRYHQLFPIGVHRDGTIWVYDGNPGYIRKFRLFKTSL